jgi:hypothetical protein
LLKSSQTIDVEPSLPTNRTFVAASSAGVSLYRVIRGRVHDLVLTCTLRDADNDGLNYASLIHGRNLQDVTISGGGTVWGSGDIWWRWNGYSYNSTGGLLCSSDTDCNHTAKATCHTNSCKAPTAVGMFGRPHTIHMWSVDNLKISNITVMRSPQWTVRLGYCSNVHINHLRVITNDTAHGELATGQPPTLYQPANTGALQSFSTPTGMHAKSAQTMRLPHAI